MDLDLTQEQQLVRDTVREFAYTAGGNRAARS